MDYLCTDNNKNIDYEDDNHNISINILDQTTNFNDNEDDNHNISINILDQSIDNIKLLRKTGEISHSEANRRLKLLKSYLEYQRECDIEDEIGQTSSSPVLFLLLFLLLLLLLLILLSLNSIIYTFYYYYY